jgi:glucans biosynthesis protein
VAVAACAWAGPSHAFGFDDVAARAMQLATHAYEDPSGRVPRWLLDIRYDEWRDIRFRPERALWRDRGLPFTVQFFHAGLFYDRTIELHTVTPKGVAPVRFSPDQFDYGKNEFGGRVPQDLGYAGFRLHYPIKTRAYQDEVIVFLGASYFRAVGRDQGFGLSARGLAIDTALPSGEEFPWFREYWLVEPTLKSEQITLYALLDSPSATGAYRFVISPGVQTRVDVTLRSSLATRSRSSASARSPACSCTARTAPPR